MKKFIVTLCLMMVMFIPGIVKAEDKKPIDIYIFHGRECPHCAKAFEFFASIEEDYGKYFTLHQYETWHSASNNDLLKEVAEAYGTKKEEVGVPYIVIGEKVFLGYSQSYDEQIKTAIKYEYNKNEGDRINKVKPIIQQREQNMKSVIIAIVVIVVLSSFVLLANFLVRRKHEKKAIEATN
jgi:glutaredoxin